MSRSKSPRVDNRKKSIGGLGELMLAAGLKTTKIQIGVPIINAIKRGPKTGLPKKTGPFQESDRLPPLTGGKIIATKRNSASPRSAVLKRTVQEVEVQSKTASKPKKKEITPLSELDQKTKYLKSIYDEETIGKRGHAEHIANRPQSKIGATRPPHLMLSETKLSLERMGLDNVVTCNHELHRDLTQDDRREIQTRLAHPGACIPKAREAGRPVDLVIGIDVGSTSSKIVMRFPYEALGAYAVPAPKGMRADGHPYYWTTGLWKTTEGVFRLLPSAGAKAIDRLKIDFLSANLDEARLDHPATYAMTAWLTLLLRQAMGWLRLTLTRGTQDLSLRVSVNCGFPMQSVENPASERAFHTCVTAARRLAMSNSELSSSTICAAQRVSDEDDASVSIVPELIGAVTGFCNSPARKSTDYLLVDVGGLTVDCVYFRLNEPDPIERSISVFGTSLESYGVDVMKSWVKLGNPAEAVSALIGHLMCQPVVSSKGKRSVIPGRKLERTQVFLIGGGRHSKEHRDGLPWALNSLANSTFAAKFEAADLTIDREEIDVSLAPLGRDCGRLLVANGLSFPEHDMPNWKHSGEVPNIPTVPPRNFEERFVGPEQT
ncbi:hypothetical protein [Pseudogemmobacter sp. W21_MBD1_M6]|uniref:hypothetical protein n=1 Tax=Pseudogemmobacter sp. W21_MBD1_M6 TaxID=3240271 RepID=UPI003F98EB58